MQITDEINVHDQIHDIANELKLDCDYAYSLKQWILILEELIHRYGEDAELEFGADTYNSYGDEFTVETRILYKTREQTPEEIQKELDDERFELEKEEILVQLQLKYKNLVGKYGTMNLLKMYSDGLLPL